jgi:hypothetical protein
MRSLILSAWFCFVVLMFSLAALAQGGAGVITGVVSDSDHAAVATASIQAKNVSSGTLFKAVSSANGSYRLSALPAGTYELTVAPPGFKPYEKRDVALQARQTLRLDIQLEDGISLNTLGEDRAAAGKLFVGAPPPDGPTPRAPDGHPDLSGVWYGATPAEGESEKPEPLPWTDPIVKERTENNAKDHPMSRCLPGFVTLLSFALNQLVQTSSVVVVLSEEDIPGHRQIYLDGREHPKDMDPTWTGHSVGSWEGDTLVVDTIGFNDRSWLTLQGLPHTEMLHMTTRLRRPNLGHLELEVTFEDPGTLKKPWTTKSVASLAANKTEIGEYICNENNQDVEHLIGK